MRGEGTCEKLTAFLAPWLATVKALQPVRFHKIDIETLIQTELGTDPFWGTVEEAHRTSGF